jgi:predicted transcriptional regulator
MELHLTEAQEARLNEMAAQAGTSTSHLLADAATSLLQIDEHHWASIYRALDQAERGELIEEDEMEQRGAKVLTR